MKPVHAAAALEPPAIACLKGELMLKYKVSQVVVIQYFFRGRVKDKKNSGTQVTATITSFFHISSTFFGILF